MQTYYSLNQFRQIEGPLIDTRSPCEYKKGHWPGAINIALFNDEERSLIGKAYKESGRNKAIVLGLKFVGPKLLALRESLASIDNYTNIALQKKETPLIRVYCWRGGMRSASFAWLAELTEKKTVLLKGGYKSYRNWALKQFENQWPLRLIGGRTGTGKTNILLALAQKGISTIDLEGLSNHRGSSFGSLGLPNQPTTEQYENLLAESLAKFGTKSTKAIWLEAESANLGRCRIPHAFFNQMKTAPLLEIVKSKEERISELVKVYGQFKSDDLADATLRIEKRLGPQRTKQALEAIRAEKWSTACNAILDYYDKCYEHELERVPNRQKIDLSGLSSDYAAETLIEKGLVF